MRRSMPFQGVAKVNFGHIAAEEEVANLQRYFIETEEYEKVKADTHKILVTGRKGSGKSAIYLALRDYLPQKDKKVVVEALYYTITLGKLIKKFVILESLMSKLTSILGNMLFGFYSQSVFSNMTKLRS
jgi:Cdc6-like AAA superfamily ATPase